MDWTARFRQKRIANVNVGRCCVFEENREISMKRPKGKKTHRDKLGSSINMNRDSLHRQSVQQCGGKPSRKKGARTSGSLMSMLFAIGETLAQNGCMGESVQASPNFRKAHPSRASLPHSPDFQIHSPWLRGKTSVQWRRSLICFSVGS